MKTLNIICLALLLATPAAQAQRFGRPVPPPKPQRPNLCIGHYVGALIINEVRTPITIQLWGGPRAVFIHNGQQQQATASCVDYGRGYASISLGSGPFYFSGEINFDGRAAYMNISDSSGKRVEARR